MAHDVDDPTSPTNEQLVIPWQIAQETTEPEVPHLVVASLLEEPGHVGSCARLDVPCWLGRGGQRAEDRGRPMVFERYRPGSSESLPRLKTANISRRQLRFTPASPEQVYVERTGKRPLLHNGQPVESC